MPTRLRRLASRVKWLIAERYGTAFFGTHRFYMAWRSSFVQTAIQTFGWNLRASTVATDLIWPQFWCTSGSESWRSFLLYYRDLESIDQTLPTIKNIFLSEVREPEKIFRRELGPIPRHYMMYAAMRNQRFVQLCRRLQPTLAQSPFTEERSSIC